MAEYAEMLLGIRLVKLETLESEDQISQTQAHYIRVVAEITSESSAEDVAIFVHQRAAVDPEDPESFKASFSHVASPFEYNELPAGIPTVDDGINLFRLDEIRAFFPSRTLLDAFWTELQSDVRVLIAAFRRAKSEMDNGHTETVTI